MVFVSVMQSVKMEPRINPPALIRGFKILAVLQPMKVSLPRGQAWQSCWLTRKRSLGSGGRDHYQVMSPEQQREPSVREQLAEISVERNPQ